MGNGAENKFNYYTYNNKDTNNKTNIEDQTNPSVEVQPSLKKEESTLIAPNPSEKELEKTIIPQLEKQLSFKEVRDIFKENLKSENVDSALIIEIKLSETIKKRISLNQHDNPLIIAKNICEENNLPNTSLIKVFSTIKGAIETISKLNQKNSPGNKQLNSKPYIAVNNPLRRGKSCENIAQFYYFQDENIALIDSYCS